LLDVSDAVFKELTRIAKKRGYIAHDRIDALLASVEICSEQIENILANSARCTSMWSRLMRQKLTKRW
jgi:hypothetical protein